MERFFNPSLIMGMLEKNPKFQKYLQLFGVLKEAGKAMGAQLEIITDQNDNEAAAILFEPTEQNKRRVQAFAEMFEDILEPCLMVLSDFELSGKHYAAIIINAPVEEAQTDGDNNH